MFILLPLLAKMLSLIRTWKVTACKIKLNLTLESFLFNYLYKLYTGKAAFWYFRKGGWKTEYSGIWTKIYFSILDV